MLSFLNLQKRKAQADVKDLLESLHDIASPSEKMTVLQGYLWNTLAPLHDMRSRNDIPRVMRRLWRAAFIKSLFGFERVDNRLSEFANLVRGTLEYFPPEGIGLLYYLLNDQPDTIAGAIDKVKVEMELWPGEYPIMVLKRRYPDLFPVS